MLFFVGAGLTLYKHFALDFPLTPGSTKTVWEVQGRIQFDAENAPAMVEMVLPTTVKSQARVLTDAKANKYDCK